MKKGALLRWLAKTKLHLILPSCALLFASSAFAQSPSSPSDAPQLDPQAPTEYDPEQLVAPKPIFTDVIDRDQVELDTNVIIEVLINVHGKVIETKVISGPPQAAALVVRASRDWSFQPALYRNQVINSRIRFLVPFFQKKARNTSPRILSSQAAEMPPARASATSKERRKVDELNPDETEIIVRGDPLSKAAPTLTREETRNLAGAFDDPLRAVESLPGVTPIASGLPLFFIRGAPPGNVGTFIDGIKVPLLYHAFLGPSVLHPALIESVTLHGGPAPVRYGRFAGAIIEAKLSPAPVEKRAEASIRLLDTGAFASAPFDDNRGYVLLGGRYSYTALILSLVQPEQSLQYWDYQTLFGYRLTQRDELSLFAFGAYDYAGDKDGVVGGTQFHRIDLRYDHRFQGGATSRVALTLGQDETRSDEGVISDQSIGARVNIKKAYAQLQIQAGLDASFDRYGLEIDPAISEPEVYDELFPARTDSSGGVYFNLNLFPQGRFKINPGVRADLYQSLGDFRLSIDPRINVEIELSPSLVAIHELAVAHQTPNFVPAIPGAQVAGLDGGLQRSLQFASTFKAQLPWAIQASLTGFVNGTQRLSDPIGTTQSFAIDETSRDERTFGRAFGMEIYLKRALTRQLGGLLSYTFSRTFRSQDSLNTPPGYERPHVLNAASTYELPKHWRISAKLAFASGILGKRTTADGLVYEPSRSFPYFRLDAKVAKRWYVDPHFNWGISLEVLNMTRSAQVLTRTCNRFGCENGGRAPITIPSIGLDAAWQ